MFVKLVWEFKYNDELSIAPIFPRPYFEEDFKLSKRSCFMSVLDSKFFQVLTERARYLAVSRPIFRRSGICLSSTFCTMAVHREKFGMFPSATIMFSQNEGDDSHLTSFGVSPRYGLYTGKDLGNSPSSIVCT